MSMWITGGTLLLGAATTAYGADQQRKATNKANDANKASVDQANALQWAQYLMGRGINPNAATGGYSTVNTKLPLWAYVSRGGGKPTKAILAPDAAMSSFAAAPGQAAPVASTSGGGSRNAVATFLDPLNVGGKNATWYDPLGIF